MTQEEKNLLLKDLGARLPYKVKMNHIADNSIDPKTLIGICKDMITLESLAGYSCVDIEHYKPYLFPLSSMTEEQIDIIDSIASSSNTVLSDVVDFYNKNHFDYRGLIPMGSAIDATGKNIY